MSDQLLFARSPYIAVAVSLLMLIIGYLRFGRDRAKLSEQFSEISQAFRRPALWQAGLLLVVAGHLALIFLPGRLLEFNDVRSGSIGLEGITIVAGFLVLTGLLQVLWRMARRLTTAETVYVTILVLSAVSGLLTGILYRWSTSWSPVTLTPYVHSLWRLDPAIDLIAGMPFLVRLHILSAFALVALFPLTRLSVIVHLPVHLILSPLLAGIVSLLGRLRDALAARGRRAVQTASAWWEAEYE